MLYNKMSFRSSVMGLFLLSVLVSCNPKENPEGENTLMYFLEQKGMSVYVNGAVIFRYDEYETQIACNPARKMLRFQTNDQGLYVQMTFSVVPGEQRGAPLAVVFNYMEAAGEPKSLRVVLEEVKREGGRCWYWDEEQKVGFVLPADWEELRE